MTNPLRSSANRLAETLYSKKIHQRVWRCKKCKDVLGDRLTPTSGFPPKNDYKIFIVGAEPGKKSKKGRRTPSDYRKSFMPGTKNTNRMRLIFEDLKSADIDYSIFFFTNAVKCPAKPEAGQPKKCFLNCETFLIDQIMAIKPKLLIVCGSAANLLRIRRATKDSIERDKYMDIPAIVIRHPQAGSKDYRKRVAMRIKHNFSRLNIT